MEWRKLSRIQQFLVFGNSELHQCGYRQWYLLSSQQPKEISFRVSQHIQALNLFLTCNLGLMIFNFLLFINRRLAIVFNWFIFSSKILVRKLGKSLFVCHVCIHLSTSAFDYMLQKYRTHSYIQINTPHQDIHTFQHRLNRL